MRYNFCVNAAPADIALDWKEIEIAFFCVCVCSFSLETTRRGVSWQEKCIREVWNWVSWKIVLRKTNQHKAVRKFSFSHERTKAI